MPTSSFGLPPRACLPPGLHPPSNSTFGRQDLSLHPGQGEILEPSFSQDSGSGHLYCCPSRPSSRPSASTCPWRGVCQGERSLLAVWGFLATTGSNSFLPTQNLFITTIYTRASQTRVLFTVELRSWATLKRYKLSHFSDVLSQHLSGWFLESVFIINFLREPHLGTSGLYHSLWHWVHLTL